MRTELEKRLERRVAGWLRQAAAYRLAQNECEPSEEEWQLNKENADRLEQCASEARSDLSAARLISRSQYEPNEPHPMRGVSVQRSLLPD